MAATGGLSPVVLTLWLPPRTRGALGHDALLDLRRDARAQGVFLTLTRRQRMSPSVSLAHRPPPTRHPRVLIVTARRDDVGCDELVAVGPRTQADLVVEAVLRAAETAGVDVEDVDPPEVWRPARHIVRRLVTPGTPFRGGDHLKNASDKTLKRPFRIPLELLQASR